MLSPIYLLLACLLLATALAYGVLMFSYANQLTALITKPVFRTHKHTPISIVIPCRNGIEGLWKVLRCIAEQDYPIEFFEVLVIDDGSDISIDDSRFPVLFKMSIIRQDKLGKKKAILKGVELAKYDHILCLDADVTFVRNYLTGINSTLSQESDLYILPVVNSKSSTFFQKLQDIEFVSLIASTFGAAVNPILCNGANICFKKNAFLAWKPFADNLHIPTGDDVFLLHAAKKHKAKIAFELKKAVWVYTDTKTSFISFVKQRVRWGSKTINYKDKQALGVAILVLAYTTFLAGLLIASIYRFDILFFFVLAFLPKFILDRNLIKIAVKQFEKEELMLIYPIFSIVYLFYVPIIAVIGLFKNLLRYSPNIK